MDREKHRSCATTVLGPTASRAVLLPGKSDRVLRKLIADLFTVAGRMAAVRQHLGARVGLSGPQFSIMMAVAELQGAAGVSVGTLARHLHVASAFVTAETGKLIRKGYIEKHADAADRRVARLRIGREGQAALRPAMPLVREVNDLFWGFESRARFAAACGAIARIVDTSERAVAVAADPKGAPAGLEERGRRAAS